ncbi:hypothetical protein HAX54_032655 [Datura stramonium]|uniref:Uncharacterized protein n=1 Tax=Datura stramonium TaxID=4076 RepID=A0ABS8VB44_DATST|nr:hypothetical protein [Datura stramonium]
MFTASDKHGAQLQEKYSKLRAQGGYHHEMVMNKASRLCSELASTWKPEDALRPYCWCVRLGYGAILRCWFEGISTSEGTFVQDKISNWHPSFCIIWEWCFMEFINSLGLPCTMDDKISWIIIWILHELGRFSDALKPDPNPKNRLTPTLRLNLELT